MPLLSRLSVKGSPKSKIPLETKVFVVLNGFLRKSVCPWSYPVTTQKSIGGVLGGY